MSGRTSDGAALTDRVGLVGCVKSKLAHAAPAADLYVSPLFRGRRAFVEKSCGRWFILSALYGVARPDAVLEPYDATLNDASRAERRSWADRVLQQLDDELGSCAGRDVRDPRRCQLHRLRVGERLAQQRGSRGAASGRPQSRPAAGLLRCGWLRAADGTGTRRPHESTARSHQPRPEVGRARCLECYLSPRRVPDARARSRLAGVP